MAENTAFCAFLENRMGLPLATSGAIEGQEGITILLELAELDYNTSRAW